MTSFGAAAKELNAMLARITTLEEQLAFANGKANQEGAKLTLLSDTVLALSSGVDKQQEGNLNSGKKAIETLDSGTAKYEEQVAALQRKVTALSSRLDYLGSESNKKDGEIAYLVAEVTTLSSRLKEIEIDVEALEDEAKSLRLEMGPEGEEENVHLQGLKARVGRIEMLLDHIKLGDRGINWENVNIGRGVQSAGSDAGNKCQSEDEEELLERTQSEPISPFKKQMSRSIKEEVQSEFGNIFSTPLGKSTSEPGHGAFNEVEAAMRELSSRKINPPEFKVEEADTPVKQPLPDSPISAISAGSDTVNFILSPPPANQKVNVTKEALDGNSNNEPDVRCDDVKGDFGDQNLHIHGEARFKGLLDPSAPPFHPQGRIFRNLEPIKEETDSEADIRDAESDGYTGYIVVGRTPPYVSSDADVERLTDEAAGSQADAKEFGNYDGTQEIATGHKVDMNKEGGHTTKENMPVAINKNPVASAVDDFFINFGKEGFSFDRTRDTDLLKALNRLRQHNSITRGSDAEKSMRSQLQDAMLLDMESNIESHRLENESDESVLERLLGVDMKVDRDTRGFYNIYDVFESLRDGANPRRFATKEEISKYSAKTGRLFPLGKIGQGSPLHKLLCKAGGHGAGSRNRGGGRNRRNRERFGRGRGVAQKNE